MYLAARCPAGPQEVPDSPGGRKWLQQQLQVTLKWLSSTSELFWYDLLGALEVTGIESHAARRIQFLSFKTITGFKTVFFSPSLSLSLDNYPAMLSRVPHMLVLCQKLSTWSSSKPPGHWQGFFPGIFYSDSCTGLSGLPLPLGSPVLNCQCEHSFINQNSIKDLRRRKKEEVKVTYDWQKLVSCLTTSKHPQTVPTAAPLPPASSFPSSLFPFGLFSKCSMSKGTKCKQMQLWPFLTKGKLVLLNIL